MNDDLNNDFLTQFQIQPRETFAAPLYRRLAAQKPARQPRFIRRMSLGIAVACAVLVVGFAASPAVRAQLAQMVYDIAGYRVGVVTEVVDPTEIVMPEKSAADLRTAERELDQTIALPTFLPDGFANEPTLTYSAVPGLKTLAILWVHKDSATLDDNNKYLALGVARGLRGTQMNMVKATPAAVQINGKPGLLTENVWTLKTDASGKVTGELLETKAKMLIWPIGELDYSISAGPNVSVEELIRMAESVK